MQKACLSALALAGVMAGWNLSAQFADSVVAYVPGSGVSSSYTNPASALGEPSRITLGPWGGPVDPFNPPWQGSQVVSIGEGGSLTLHLSTAITNDPANPFGLDFIIFGNAGFNITNGDYSGGGITDGSLFGNNAGVTRISVSSDGTNFYALNPAVAPVADGLFPTDGSGNFYLPLNRVLAGSDFSGRDLRGIRALYAGSGGGAGYDLGWAQDSNEVSVPLASASFVRVDVLSGKSEIDAVAKAAPAWSTLFENFTSNPASQGWRWFGDTNLFRWNPANGNLEVIWDSSRSNSYLQFPLGTILTRRDDFQVELDLLLRDFAAGVNPNKPSTFQIAFGFQNRSDAERTNFNRGTGSDSPNLVEFNFFPDTGWGPTVWPAIYSTNSGMNYNSPADFSLFDLPLEVTMHIVLAYTSSNETARISVSTNGVLVGPVTAARLATNYSALGGAFTQFKLDTFAIASYSDLGLPPDQFSGSILAHGVVDNLLVRFPPPPVQEFRGALAGGHWQAECLTRTNWSYGLEATSDFNLWTEASLPQAGTGGQIRLQDTNSADFRARFYRIKASRPD